MSTIVFSDLKIESLKTLNRNIGGAGTQHGVILEVTPAEQLLGSSVPRARSSTSV
jgi:hypothetical protein